jgi:hypothetical protein
VPSTTAIGDLSAQVREAFDEACRAVFDIGVQRSSAGHVRHDVLLDFATRYQRLGGLPRRMRRALQRRWKCTLSVVALLMTLGQVPVWAATIEVSPGTPPSINADGRCSLIEAIVNANRDARTHLDCVAGSGADTIILPEQSQQVLKAPENLPKIWSKIVIEGHDSTIRRNSSSHDYQNFFSITAAGDLTLNETTISGVTTGGYGGAVYFGINNAGGSVRLIDSSILDAYSTGLVTTGVATLDGSTVSGNGLAGGAQYFGAGIANRNGGSLVLRNSTVTGNKGFRVGGIHNDKDSTATLIDSVVSGNYASFPQGLGGGISNRGSLDLVRSTVSGNRAYYGAGGIDNSGTATLARSTVSANTAKGGFGGGGINNWETGILTVTNSTVSGNRAVYGGGLSNRGKLTIVSSTVTRNEVWVGTEPAWHSGGGLLNHPGATVTLQHSIVSGNTAGAGPEINNQPLSGGGYGGTVIADEYNLVGHDGDAGVVGVNLGSTDIVPSKAVAGILLPLADNGGGTQTHALAIGSPALNASPDDAGCRAIDQRGNPRPRGAACDIGAFEGSAVLCNNRVTTMVGTVNADDMTGTPGLDIISGLGGNDIISGLDGNDLICAGGGADVLYGGTGNDVMNGEAGNDKLFGNRGDDRLNGGPDVDRCDGGVNSTAGDTAVACETVITVP